MLTTQPRNWRTSSGLKTTGSFCGFFGAGITSSKIQFFLRETLYRKRKAATAIRTELGASFFSLVK